MQQQLRRRMVFGALSNWLVFALTLAISFFLMPYMVKRLGEATYGIWAFVESIVAYFTLFDLGIAASAVRYAARFYARNDTDALNRLASSCLALFTCLGIVAFLGAFAVLPLILPTLHQPDIDFEDAQMFLLFMLATFAINLPASLFPALLDGLEQYTAKSIWRLVVLAGRTTSIIVWMEWQSCLSGLGIVFAIWTLIETLGLLLLLLRFHRGWRFSWRLVDRESLQLVRGYSIDAFLAMLAGRLSVQSGAMIIGLCLEAKAITVFVVGLRLVEQAKSLLRAATNPMTGSIANLESRGDFASIRRIFLAATRWSLYLMLPIQAGLWHLGGNFLQLWLGAGELVTQATPILMILTTTLALGGLQSVAARILYGSGQIRTFARLTFAEGLLGIVTSIALIRPLGIQGVAIAYVLPNTLIIGIIIIHTCRRIELSIAQWLREMIWPMFALLPMILIWNVLPNNAETWGQLFGLAIAGMIGFSAVVLGIEWPRQSSRKPVEIAMMMKN